MKKGKDALFKEKKHGSLKYSLNIEEGFATTTEGTIENARAKRTPDSQGERRLPRDAKHGHSSTKAIGQIGLSRKKKQRKLEARGKKTKKDPA